MLSAPLTKRRLAGLIAASLCALGLGTTAGAGAAHATALSAAGHPSIRATVQLTPDQASAQARRTRKAVPVPSAETSTEQLTANADGSFTIDQSVEPVRKQVHGVWKPLNASLQRDGATGTVSPAVTTDGLQLSDGGRGPLAVMRSGNAALTLSVPTDLGPLPVPTLSGDTATYANVLPGVDLEMTADTQGGYQEVLVVHNARAAASPALKTLVFPASATGATLSSDAAGNISVTTREGRTVFTAPEPLMWDSSAPPVGKVIHQVTNPATGARVDAATGQPVSSSASLPGEGAHVTRVGAHAGAHAVTLEPDGSMLTSHATRWPVYIDPTYAAGGNDSGGWTFVDSYYDSASYWKNTGATAMHVGDEDWSGPYSKDRTFVQMSVPPVLYNPSTHITGSTFYATENWSASCTSEPVQLWWTGAISSGTDWDNQPAWNSEVASDNIASGWSSSCPAASIGWTTTSLMERAAGSSPEWTNVTLGLQAGNENNSLNWEEFDPSTMKMSTTYDVTPNTPTVLATNPASSCTGAVTTLGNGSVSLLAQVNSAAGGSLTADFKSWETNASSTTVDNGAVAATSSTSGYNAALLIPELTLSKLAAGSQLEVSWDVSVTDGTMTSGTSHTCTFYFNPTAPGAPSISDSATPPVDCNSSALTYTVGVPAVFTLAPNASGAAPTSYLYQLNGGGAATTPADQNTITVLPTRRTNVLTVTAVSAGGNIGDSATCVINAGPAATAPDGDLTSDGSPDLLTTGGQAGLPSGLWLNNGLGAGSGQVATASSDVGIQGSGIDTSVSSSSPSQWNGLQAFTGHFAGQGTGFNDVMDYNPATGVGKILDGSGDGSPLSTAGAQNVDPDDLEDSSTTPPAYATHVANAGNLNNTASDNTDTNGNIMVSYPDLLVTIDGGLYLQPSVSGGAGTYAPFTPGSSGSPELLVNDPTGGANTSWAGWTVTTCLVATSSYTDLPAMFARNDSTGALYYYSPTDMDQLAENAIMGTSYTVTPALLASSGWSASAYPSIEAANISPGGNPGLWAVNASGNVTAVTLAGTTVAATSATSTTASTGTPQPLTADSHTWPLDDDSTNGTTVTSAADTAGNPTPLTLTPYPTKASNATWNSKDPSFPNDIVFSGGTGVLTTSAPAVPMNGSFTVSAWVKPTTDSTAVLSQDGNGDSAMMLAATPSGWQFALNNQSGTGWSFDSIYGGNVDLGTWAHLTATYNQVNGVMNLYVDNVYVATGTHTPSTTNDGTGDLQLGGSLHSGVNASFFSGEMADVETWSGSVLPPAQPYSPPSYHQSVTATRILDTRSSYAYTNLTGTPGASTVTGGSVTQLDIARDTVAPATTGSPTAIPSSVTAVAVDVTAVNQNSAGFITAYADGTQRPITSSTNYTADDTVTGYQIVPVGTDGKIDLYTAGTSADTTALIVDLTGYFTSDPTVANGQTYTPLAGATRVLNTATSTGLSGTNLSTANGNLTSTGAVAAYSSFNLDIAGANGVPSTATAVAVNLTTTAEASGGYLQAYATGSAPANLTSLTYSTSNIASMAADIPIGTGGQITINNCGGATDVIADISGYYTPTGSGEMYHAVNPTRLVDTRNGTGSATGTVSPIGAESSYTISQADTQQITTLNSPTLVTMLTTTDSTGNGFITAYPTGTTQPGTSNINWTTDENVSNLALTPVGSGSNAGQITIYNASSGSTDLVVDCSGYFD